MFQLTLPLTFDTVKAAYQAGLDAIQAGQTEIDLAKVTAADSSAVAALIAWKRAAAQRGINLVLSNIPADLQSLADLYGASSLLQLSDTSSLPRADLPHHHG